jgi:hypothetical protein
MENAGNSQRTGLEARGRGRAALSEKCGAWIPSERRLLDVRPNLYRWSSLPGEGRYSRGSPSQLPPDNKGTSLQATGIAWHDLQTDYVLPCSLCNGAYRLCDSTRAGSTHFLERERRATGSWAGQKGPAKQSQRFGAVCSLNQRVSQRALATSV